MYKSKTLLYVNHVELYLTHVKEMVTYFDLEGTYERKTITQS